MQAIIKAENAPPIVFDSQIIYWGHWARVSGNAAKIYPVILALNMIKTTLDKIPELAGGKLPLDLMSQLSGMTVVEVEAAIKELMDRGFIKPKNFKTSERTIPIDWGRNRN